MLYLYPLLVSLLSLAVHATPVETNASRLSRGLSPKPPARFGAILPGHATGMNNARRSQIPTPLNYTGALLSRGLVGTGSGYIRNAPYGINGYNFAGGPNLNIAFSVEGDKRFDIRVTNPTFLAPFYLGMGTSYSPAVLGKGLYGGTPLVNVARTPVNSPPVQDGDKYYESAIWTFDATTRRLTPHWVNPDGSQAVVAIGYRIRENDLFLTGDIELYRSYKTGVSEVAFYLDDGPR